ncbi:hypothetical protein SmJEL517_g02497 [Synchytrium microbalum]|uniref:RRM domain-containing protein n=1 Tax=Synchytrium microbalum TaxID=1806994 RepID=A0A507C5R8_9FUNG|nr:uncharacterized protein SmJEL517_g02497 [Synchytrium microbalum]TPX34992.1 hypothetical protein SmJEL517_g02497 [Synchytrium microbalum]
MAEGQQETGTKCFVGKSSLLLRNLSWSTTSESMRGAFERFGEVTDSFVLKDRETGRSRGFGFITFAAPQSAQDAIAQMDGQDLEGRNVRVNLANDKGDRDGGSGGGFRGGRGGGFRGGRGGGRGGYSNDSGNWRQGGGGGGYDNQQQQGGGQW